MNENTGGSLENSRKRKISHILVTTPIHATEYSGEIGLNRKIKY